MNAWSCHRNLGVFVVALLAAACTKGHASPAVAGNGGGAGCGKKFDGVVSYLERFKNANVLSTDIAVPPAEGKSGQILVADAHRRLLQCDLNTCWTSAK